MKLVLFTVHGGSPTAGVLRADGVVPLPDFEGPLALHGVIDHFAEIRSDGAAIPLDRVQLQAPLPRPGKIVCSTATYGAVQAERTPLLLTLKSAESVIGPGQNVRLPEVGPEWTFVPEAELGVVFRGPVKNVKVSDWQRAVFGYTCVIDVMAQGDTQFGRDFWLAKSDTLGPLGPCVVTADEVSDPAMLRVQSFVNGKSAQDYSVGTGDYSVAEQIELATTIMTLNTGDVLACGTAREGLRVLGDGDQLEVNISGVGQLRVSVRQGAHV